VAFLRSTRTTQAFDRVTASQTPDTIAPETPLAGVGLNPDGTLYYIDDMPVPRYQAEQVPAYWRAKTLIAGSLGELQFRQLNSKGVQLPTIPFLRQPDPGRVRSAILADTFHDLCDYGVAYWYNEDWNSEDGWRYNDADRTRRKHKAVRYLPIEDVLEVRDKSYVINVEGEGVTVPSYAVIAFECRAGDWLRKGARAITTARLLEDAARKYAGSPAPNMLLRNTGPRKTPEQVAELLDALELGKRSRSAVYLGRDLELETSGFDATQIALSDARGTAILDIARVTGVPCLYLFQGPNDASMTYSNMLMQRLDLHAAMLPYATAVAQRLSLDDVTGEGATVEVDFSDFLRVDPTMRADLYQRLIPLGVMTVDEARAMENLAGDPESEKSAGRELSIAEVVQKVYLGVGKVLTVDEARQIVNQAGADLPIPGPDNLGSGTE